MKKKGSELKAGDIVTRLPGNEHGPGLTVRLVFLMETTIGPDERGANVVDMQEAPRLRIDRRYFRPNETYEVAAPEPAVTPDELALLVTAARMVVGSDMPHPGRLVELVDRLDPPVPPTLDEVLSELNECYERACAGDPANFSSTVQAILDRARRTGLL